MTNEFKVDWTQFERDSKALAWKLKELALIGIVAVSRGGLIPASIIAHELNITMLDTVCISSYIDREQTTPLVMKPSLNWSATNIVVIDDLVDTGKSFELLRSSYLQRCHYASVYAKPLGKKAVDTYVTEVSQDTWIVFPWER